MKKKKKNLNKDSRPSPKKKKNAPCKNKDIQVAGYERDDGTPVKKHCRSR